jgi:predicted phage terminase large subunit-like protein
VQANDVSAALTDPFLTPATLAMSLWPSGPDQWLPQKHLLYASSRIVNAILRGNGRLIVSMPPRHGKSRLISESTIPWFLEKFPGRNMMFVAYNGDFAEEWGGKAKDIIKARQDLFSYSLRDDRSRVDRFETTKGSTCWFAGINGGQTGKGAHLVVIDDYIKDIEQAMSATERNKMWDKFVANIFTRLEPGATIIIVATRWWSDDLIGRVNKHLKGWEYICFPAIATAKSVDPIKGVDVLGRKPGDVLFPERYPIWRLQEMRDAANVAGVVFDALYQQEPIDDQSDFTDGQWLRVANGINPADYTCARAWDMAATQGGGDFTTGTKMGRKALARQAFIFNVIRKQLSPLRVEELIRATAVADGIECTVLLEQEPGSQGTALVEHYKRNVLPEFTVIGVPAGNKSKLLKAQPLIAATQSGNVYLVDDSNAQEEPEWIKLYRDEFDNFPPTQGGHDDQVDTSAICYNHLFAAEASMLAWGRGESHKSQVAFGIGSYNKLDPNLDAVFDNSAKPSPLITGAVW